jgi:hypothetical protein
MTDLSALLAPVRARAEAATEGPWEIERYPHGGGRIWKKLHSGNRSLIADTFDGAGNREFLFHARSDVPRLLKAIEAVAALADKWRAESVTDNSVDVTLRAVTYHIRSALTAALEGEA